MKQKIVLYSTNDPMNFNVYCWKCQIGILFFGACCSFSTISSIVMRLIQSCICTYITNTVMTLNPAFDNPEPLLSSQ